MRRSPVRGRQPLRGRSRSSSYSIDSRSRSRSRSFSRSSYSSGSRSFSRSPRSRSRSFSRSPRRSRLRSLSPPLKLVSPRISKTLLVQNLSKNLMVAHINEIFGKFGKVVKVTLPFNGYNMQNTKTLNALVEFDDRKDAEIAINRMNGGMIDGLDVSCRFMTAQDERKSRNDKQKRFPSPRGYTRRVRTPLRRDRRLSRSPVEYRPGRSRSRSPFRKIARSSVRSRSMSRSPKRIRRNRSRSPMSRSPRRTTRYRSRSRSPRGNGRNRSRSWSRSPHRRVPIGRSLPGDRKSGCFNCGKEGHIARDCDRPRKALADSQKCYNCGEMGHISRDCNRPKKGPMCYNCGKEGHIARDCRESTSGRVVMRQRSRSPIRGRKSRSPIGRSPIRGRGYDSKSPINKRNDSFSRSPPKRRFDSPRKNSKSPMSSPIRK